MKTKYFKTTFLSLSLCFIFSAASSTPDTTVISANVNYIWGNGSGGGGMWGNGQYNLTFDQSRNMPPGDKMYVEIQTFSICCGNTPWHKLSAYSYPVNWYNDTVNYAFTGSSNGYIHTSIDISGGGGSVASIYIRFVYISNNGFIGATISNARYDLAPMHLGNVYSTINGSPCDKPLNVTFHLPVDCYQCQGSAGSDIHVTADFGDGIDTFYTIYGPGPYSTFNLSHTYPVNGTFHAHIYIYNAYGNGTATVPVTGYPKPPAQVTAGSSVFCTGDSVVLNAVYNPDHTYQWSKGSIDIPGATTSAYTTKVGGAYRVTVTSTITGCSKTTPYAKILTKYQFPVPGITPQGPTTFCAGDSVVLTANTGTGLIYQWKKDGTLITGATSIDYSAKTAGIYKVQEINSYGCRRTSGGVTVTVPCREENEIPGDRSGLLIFPNPSTGYFTIETAGEIISQITVTNLLGQIVFKREFQNDFNFEMKMRLTNQSKGIYMVKVLTNKKVYSEKIILN